MGEQEHSPWMLAAVIGACLGSCTNAPSTVTVSLQSDLEIPSGADQLVVRVSDQNGALSEQQYDLGQPPRDQWPQTLPITAGSLHAPSVTITAELRLKAESETSTLVGFGEGTTAFLGQQNVPLGIQIAKACTSSVTQGLLFGADCDSTEPKQEDPDPDPDPEPRTDLVAGNLLARFLIGEIEPSTALADESEATSLLVVQDNSDPTLVDDSGHRGLSFQTSGSDARACTAVAGTTIAQIADSQGVTLEVVVNVLGGFNESLRLVNIGAAGEWGFSLGYNNSDGQILFASNGRTSGPYFGVWDIDVATLPRTVLTVVYDSTHSIGADRVRLYIDGSLSAANTAQNINVAQNALITIEPNAFFCVGNRATGGRSVSGTIYYAAIYGAVLTNSEILQNANNLLASDD